MIKLDINLPVGYTSDDIRDAVCSRIPISRDEIKSAELLRRTLDLSADGAPKYKCTVAITSSEERETGLLKIRNKVFPYERRVFSAPPCVLDFRPVVVGAGPAGMFAALVLAEAGARPILLERGLPADERVRKVDMFNALGVLDPECNVQFGEGGAGTFSDGKLKSGSIDEYKLRVLLEFVEAGADADITYSDMAHLGTDKLPMIVTRIREKIISLGGEVIFAAKLTELRLKEGELRSVAYVKDGKLAEIDTRAAIIAVGHSARDTIRMLYDAGLPMEARGFGVGVRIEHPREHINRIVYGGSAHLIKDTASYHLVTHLPSGRSVYSFCMCPGGSVVAATSEAGHIVTNGMSEHARMGDNSNAALLVSVTPADFGSGSPLAGIEYQKRIERAAYNLTSSYKAPCARLAEFMKGAESKELGECTPSYPLGTELGSFDACLPDHITESLRLGMVDFEDWLPGYMYPDATLTAPETRTTSPIRILRSESGAALGFSGIYPAGEGAGYAGGIVSAATDGVRIAEKLLTAYKTGQT